MFIRELNNIKTKSSEWRQGVYYDAKLVTPNNIDVDKIPDIDLNQDFSKDDVMVSVELHPKEHDKVEFKSLPNTIFFNKRTTEIVVGNNQSKVVRSIIIRYDDTPSVEFVFHDCTNKMFSTRGVIITSDYTYLQPSNQGVDTIVLNNTCEYYDYVYQHYNYVMKAIGREGDEIGCKNGSVTEEKKIDYDLFYNRFTSAMIGIRLVDIDMNFKKLLEAGELIYLQLSEPVSYGIKINLTKKDILSSLLNLYTLSQFDYTGDLTYNIIQTFKYPSKVLDMARRDVFGFIEDCKSETCRHSIRENTTYSRVVNYLGGQLFNEVYTTCKFCNIILTNVYQGNNLIATAFGNVEKDYGGAPTRYYYLNGKVRMVIWYNITDGIVRAEVLNKDEELKYILRLVNNDGSEYVVGSGSDDARYEIDNI